MVDLRNLVIDLGLGERRRQGEPKIVTQVLDPFPDSYQGAFRFRQHPPSSWGLIEHRQLERSTVIFCPKGPIQLAQILAAGYHKLQEIGEQETISLVKTASLGWEQTAVIKFGLYGHIDRYHQMLVDGVLRDATLRIWGAKSEAAIELYDPLSEAIRGNEQLIFKILREFPLCR